MRLFTPLLVLSALAVARLCGSENERAIEDDLDAIVSPKNVPGATEADDERKPQRPVDPQVEAIVLPANPTKADVHAFLKALRDAGVKSQPNSSLPGRIISYPIIDVKRKLKGLPAQYLGDTLDYATDEKAVPSFRHAIVDEINSRKTVDESLREIVLKRLPDCPDLIVTVVRQGWEKGQEKLILKTLKGVQAMDQNYTPKRLNCRRIGHYVSVLVGYGTESSLKMLRELLTNRRSSREMMSCFSALPDKDVPGLDRTEIVQKAWEKAKGTSGVLSGPDQYATTAAKYGQLEALVFMAKKLNGPPSQSANPIEKQTRAQMGKSLLELVPEGGSNEASVVRYVLTNRTKLAYNKSEKTYRLP